MKKLICTRADKNIADMAELSHPLLKEYAKKVGADFCVLDSEKWRMAGISIHYRIADILDLFETYDRVCQIDTDTIILPSMPDIFECVDPKNVGVACEDVGTREDDRRRRMQAACNKWGGVWLENYPNTGIIVLSRCHRAILEPVDGGYWSSRGYDDVHIGYQINRLRVPLHRLHWKWNHMTMFSERWNGRPDRFKSFMIHYAGQGVFERGPKTRLDQMLRDKRKVYGC
jgi:hypothetical protein